MSSDFQIDFNDSAINIIMSVDVWVIMNLLNCVNLVTELNFTSCVLVCVCVCMCVRVCVCMCVGVYKSVQESRGCSVIQRRWSCLLGTSLQPSVWLRPTRPGHTLHIKHVSGSSCSYTHQSTSSALWQQIHCSHLVDVPKNWPLKYYSNFLTTIQRCYVKSCTLVTCYRPEKLCCNSHRTVCL